MPHGEEISRIPKLARIHISIGRRQSESLLWIVSRGTTCRWFTLMIHRTGRKKAKGLRGVVSHVVHYALRGRRMPRERSRSCKSVGQLITWNNYVLFWRRQRRLLLLLVWWWPRWLMDISPSREGCLRSRVKMHVERTSRKERASERLRKQERKSAQKRAETRGRQDPEVPCARRRLGTTEEAEKGELSLAAEFLRRATQGEAEVNPHQRSSRWLKIPALTIFMTVSSTGEIATAAQKIARSDCEDSLVPVTCATKRYICYDVFQSFLCNTMYHCELV